MASEESALVEAARAGDERAFVQLTAVHRGALHAHCYRLLGSVRDADDALQDTLLRAWRGMEAFEPRAPLRAWLYRIATNVCLRMLERRSRAPVASIDVYLEPYPDAPGSLVPHADGPAAAVERREAIGLAAVNSALRRARERLARERVQQTLARVNAAADAATEAAVMRRFQDAWDAVDIDGSVALPVDDALLTMPPESVRVAGDRLAGITGFPDHGELFERLGLPVTLTP
jgi:RNA polymerase sigma factor (sigma-70 family)